VRLQWACKIMEQGRNNTTKGEYEEIIEVMQSLYLRQYFHPHTFPTCHFSRDVISAWLVDGEYFEKWDKCIRAKWCISYFQESLKNMHRPSRLVFMDTVTCKCTIGLDMQTLKPREWNFPCSVNLGVNNISTSALVLLWIDYGWVCYSLGESALILVCAQE